MEIWKYYNAHPDNKNVKDCVVRAYCTACKIDYLDARKELNRFCKQFNLKYKNRFVIHKFMDSKNFTKIRFPAQKGFNRMNGHMFAITYPTGKYILNMAHHLTCCIDGIIYDTWDCTDKCVYNAWKVEE